MIKYHGAPITPKEVFNQSLIGRNCLVPFMDRRDFNRAVKLCDNILIDNSAYSVWRNKIKIDWNDYYDWIDEICDDISYFFIPDVIDGTEEENDKLIVDFFKRYRHDTFRKKPNQVEKAIPVWHIDESFDRLKRMMCNFTYIAIGSSGEYWKLGTDKWHRRMNEAMKVLCNKDGFPKVKIHMLRCLDPDIFVHYPFHSGDSTNLAQNHSSYNSVKGNKSKGIEPSNDGWKVIIRRTYKYDSPNKYTFKFYPTFRSLF